MPYIESVPNFSEGKNASTISEIGAALNSARGAALLHVDSNADANRTVYTLAGEPSAVAEAILRGARVARERIDMRAHSGEHPRIGALDVLPFVPLEGSTLADCDRLAREVAARLTEELGVAAYLYAHSAVKPEREHLSSLRACEYEGLIERAKDPSWAPDYWPGFIDPCWGATAVGARGFLVAWNISLSAADLNAAKEIARELRETGFHGKPGRFKGLKAIGWIMEGYGRAQISCNVTDFRAAPLLEIYGAARALAAARGLAVEGSELIGLIPEEALRAAGRGSAERAVGELGLELHGHFDLEERVLERALAKRLTAG
jgi:glutamate formiminotransferase/formiminotetrahydrofolate cyclodeaminase